MEKKLILIIVFFAALLLRLLLITSAHHGDLNNNISWGQVALEKGLNGFYGSDNSDDWPYSAPNQPPLYILMFTGLAFIWKFLNNLIWTLNSWIPAFPSALVWFWEEKGMDVVVKSPSIVADLGIGWMIYNHILHKWKKTFKTAVFFTIIWLFNPVVWYNSAVWGQTDSIVNLLGLIAIFSLINRKLLQFCLFFTLSLLFKGSLAIFIPVLLYIIWKQKYDVLELLQAVFITILTTVIIAIWFHPQFDLPLWLVDLYQNRILPGEVGFLTANAFNVWWLVDSGNIYDSTLFLGLSARFWGFLISLTGISSVIYWLSKRKLSDIRIFVSLFLVAFITFLFMTRIHERYLYPIFPFATLIAAYNPYFLLYYFLISIIHLFNLYHLFWIPSLPILENLYSNPILANSLSFILLLLFFMTLRHLRLAKL